MSTPRSLSNLRRLGLSLLLIGGLAATQTACGEAGEGPGLDAEDAQGISYGRDDSGRITPGTPEGDAVVAFVNQPLVDDAAAQSFLATLQSELHELPAGAIHGFRVGADGAAGTADDATFADLKAIDDLPYTGPAAFDQLLTLATNAGFFQPAGGDCMEFTVEVPRRNIPAITSYAQLLRIRDSGCTYFSGNVDIMTGADELLPDARQLEPLSKVTRVDGTLGIRANTGLVGLQGLRNLTQVQGLRISKNTSLTSLDGLQGLTRIEGELLIEENAQLASLEGLDNLTYLRSLTIRGNYALTSLQGLDQLVEIGGNLSLARNKQLDDMTGLGSLTTVRGELKVADSLAILGAQPLTPFVGLTNLESVESLKIVGYEVENFDGLQGLETIEGSLTVEHSHLTSTAGLDGLRSIGGDIHIVENRSIKAVEGFPMLESVGGDITIKDNSYSLHIRGFASLKNVSGTLTLYPGGYDGPTLSGFDALQTAGAIDLYLSSGQTALSALSALTAVDGEVSITGKAVTDLRSLDALQLTGGLKLKTDAQEVQGFASLTTVDGDFDTGYAPNLLHLDNFGALTNVGGDIRVAYGLPQDALDRFLGQLEYFQGSIERN